MKATDPVSSSGHPRTLTHTARVLLVDDEPALRRFAARVLAEEGYTIHEAGDGAQALELLKESGGQIDVIVSDVVMPRLNGVELMRALSLSHPDIPIVLMSGYVTTDLDARGIAAPCGILNKPFSAERLVGEVRRCLGPKSATP